MKARCPLISSVPMRLPRAPVRFERRRPSRPSGTGQAQIITLRLLGIAVLVMTSSQCSPRQTPWASVPKTELECGTKAMRPWAPLPSELRALADELADKLPDWSSTQDSSVNLDYESLKAAAIKFASAPFCVQSAVIETYSKEYCEPGRTNLPKASGMYLLLRVLFVLPTDYPKEDAERFSTWSYPLREEALRTSKWDLSWPVHQKPGDNVLEIERCQGFPGGDNNTYKVYQAFDEFRYFRTPKVSRMRTPAEIEALEIKSRP